MNVIKVLSDQEAKKIAAGEVVERPASVVKELVENSLDAHAKKISLYIEKAGKELIRVVDDGHGMMPEDAKICFDNHATSKIKSLDDLEHIESFGFRGEALATISSVSEVSLQTRYRDRDTGVELHLVDGKIVKDDVVACAQGTDLQIKNLFYNTPVRKKFLKQDETEWNQIQNLFQAFCLSRLDVHFQLYRDGRMILNAPAIESIKDRVMQIWGYNLTQNVVEVVQDEKKGFTISGLISNHNFWRYGRQQVFFFVNGRWVKNIELSKAVMKGYRNVLPPARFPAVFLFIKLDRNLVDINVHPRKEEVRFLKPVTIQNAIHSLVTKTLEGVINKQLAGIELPRYDRVAGTRDERIKGEPFVSSDLQSKSYRDIKMQEDCCTQVPVVHLAQESKESQTDAQNVIEQTKSIGKILGQLMNTYIIIENEDGLLLIDQHAAHERILYEKYLKNFEHKDGTRLMFPEIIRLSEPNLKMVLREKKFLLRQGIEVEQIGDDELAIKTSPPKLQSQSLKELIFEMIEFIEENEELEEEVFRKKLNEHMHGQMACKMAIKAGDKLSDEMIQNLVSQLQQVDNRFICVHGRPTTWNVGKNELEKWFRRC